MNDKGSVFSNLSINFFKNNMRFSLPDRHEQIFTLISQDLFETPLYFKNTNIFSTTTLEKKINLEDYMRRVKDQNIPLTEIVNDINMIGDKMIYLERQEIQKQVPFIFR